MDLSSLGLPQSVRDLVARRVRRLPGPVNDVLTLASVVGSQFGVSLLALTSAAKSIDLAVDATLKDPATRTADLGGKLGTQEFARAVAAKLARAR